MPGDAEFEAEQGYIDRAYDWLAAMRERAAALVGQSDDPDLEWALARRVAVLADTGRPLCFGRIDCVSGERWYIGRRHVEDDRADPVVVEWRAPVAVPFYRAGLSDPQGLTRRRQFVVDGRMLLSMADDRFGPGAEAESADPRVRGRDALLAELERGRTGEMLDIVATIQAEQDEVIRAPLEGVLAVQGGPGTGKTAIGLHRAAYLLYAHPELARAGVLVIGPNRIFLRYIAQVLPSLGEESVVQTTLRDLVPDVRVRSHDTSEGARVKGDRRMADVIARALADRRRPAEDIELRYGLARVRVPAQDLDAAATALARRQAPYSTGRTALRERLLRVAYERYASTVGRPNAVDFGLVARDLRRDPVLRAALDRLWPSVPPVALVRELLCSPARLASASSGILGHDEQRAILRPPARRASAEPWTDADVALVDEAAAAVHGQARTYGHVVADEAQDLSPMQVRMLARRCPAGSFTVLGDIAQGIGPWARDGWEEVLADVPAPRGTRLTELRLGYRSPGRVLDLASRLLPTAAPQVVPTESIRPGRTFPSIRAVPLDGLGAAVVEEAAALATRYRSVAVIAPSARVRALERSLAGAGLDWADADQGGLDHPVTVVAASEARGLEFDAVVVVEPAEIAADAARGLRLVYVTLTRPTQHLSVLHCAPLPAALTA